MLFFDVPGQTLNGTVVLLLASLAGVIGGMAWASITALLKDRFNANEILVSLMLTYIAQQLMLWVVNGPLKDPNGMNFPQSKVFSSEYLLPNLMSGSRLHAGFAVMLVLVVVMTAFIFRSFAGYRLQVGGTAPAAARYAGFSSRSALWSALLISGATAGLAGAFEVTGPIGQLLPSISPGYGFTAIIVAFVGRLHPVGTVLGGIMMSLFYIGGEMAQSRLGLRRPSAGCSRACCCSSCSPATPLSKTACAGAPRQPERSYSKTWNNSLLSSPPRSTPAPRCCWPRWAC